jgi:hypothetical protein
MLDPRLEAIDEVMLMKTGEDGATALRVVDLGDSTTFGRLRLTMGDGCCLVVYV